MNPPLLQLKSEKPKTDWKFTASLLIVIITSVILVGKMNEVIDAYRSVAAENTTARSNIRALGGTLCWQCHGSTGKFLPRRQNLSEQEFMLYVRSKSARGGWDRGKMPEFYKDEITDDELKRMYLILYSTLTR